MKVKELIEHLSKFPEDWEIDSIGFKDGKTKLQVSFNIEIKKIPRKYDPSLLHEPIYISPWKASLSPLLRG